MEISFFKKLLFLSGSLIIVTLLLYGCNTTGNISPEDTYSDHEQKNDISSDSKDIPSGEQEQEEPLEEYIPNEEDVVLKNNVLENVDILEDFMKVAGENNDSQIRVVKYVGSQGAIIYDLKSRYDKNADEGWIEVAPDMSFYKASENEVQDVFNNARQQCGYMSKDEVQGVYKLNECRTHWEYRLLPIVSDDEG